MSMAEDDPKEVVYSGTEILNRLADVSAMLHDQVGDRAELLKERVWLVEQAHRAGLLRKNLSPPPPQMLRPCSSAWRRSASAVLNQGSGKYLRHAEQVFLVGCA